MTLLAFSRVLLVLSLRRGATLVVGPETITSLWKIDLTSVNILLYPFDVSYISVDWQFHH